MTELQRAALELARGLSSRPAEIERVARQTSPEAAAWAFQQWEMRERAKTKFSQAESMLFDRDGLEMATHESVAAHHAAHFPIGAPVLDLTGGIGSDSIALAARGPVFSCEVDSARAELLAHNLGTDIWRGDGRDLLGEFEYVWLDPMRRGGGRRLNPDDYGPNPWEMKEKLAAKRLAGIKLSPLVDDALLTDLGSAVEFISFGGECREAVVWTGSDAPKGIWAAHLESRSRLERHPEEARVEQAAAFVFEADPAAIRAHALGAFGMARLGDSPGYLTGEKVISSPWLTGYEVVWQGPLRLAKIQEACRSFNLNIEAVKKRGIDLDPPTLRRQIKAKGAQSAILIAYSFQKHHRVLLTKKLASP